jgi:hypothetical protein
MLFIVIATLHEGNAMKKILANSLLIAVIGAAFFADNASALPTTPSGSWANLQDFIALSYFPGSKIPISLLDFQGVWQYTPIGKESGNVNEIEEPTDGTPGAGAANDGLTFTTNDFSNWGIWKTVNFSATNLYFEDSDGPYNVALDPFLTTSDPGFKIYQLTENSNLLSYLSNIIQLKAGDYIIGYNDNCAKFSDSDYDDIIIAMRPVPEPATMFLIGTGVVGLIGMRRKNSKT